MFLLYKNDPQAQSNSHTYLHTDDTTICHQHENVLEIQNVLNKIFAKTYNWFVDSKLFGDHFGECKTKCILFTSEKNYQSLTQHTITI